MTNQDIETFFAVLDHGTMTAAAEAHTSIITPDKDDLTLLRGKRLENWELDYYRTHRAVVELRGVESAEEQAEKRRLLELLGG